MIISLPQFIYLDTNILFRLPFRQSESADVGFNLIKDTAISFGIEICSPLICVKELANKRFEEARRLLSELKQAGPRLSHLTGKQIDTAVIPHFDKESVFHQAMQFLHSHGIKIIDTPPGLVSDEILEKAAFKLPPFSKDDRDKGLCDLIVYETCRHHLQASGSKLAMLISDDDKFVRFCNEQRNFLSFRTIPEARDAIWDIVVRFEDNSRLLEKNEILEAAQLDSEHILKFTKRNAKVSEMLFTGLYAMFEPDREKDLPEGASVEEIIAFEPLQISDVTILAPKKDQPENSTRALISVQTKFELNISYPKQGFWGPEPISLNETNKFDRTTNRWWMREDATKTVYRDLHVTGYFETTASKISLVELKEGFDFELE